MLRSFKHCYSSTNTPLIPDSHYSWDPGVPGSISFCPGYCSNFPKGLLASTLFTKDKTILHTAVRNPPKKWDHVICALNLLMTSFLMGHKALHVSCLALFFPSSLFSTLTFSVPCTLLTFLPQNLQICFFCLKYSLLRYPHWWLCNFPQGSVHEAFPNLI